MTDATTDALQTASRAANDIPTRVLHASAAVTLAISGYIHAQLYLDGYRFIHAIGVLFLIQAAASFGVATLLLAASLLPVPALIQLAGAGAALGALGGFAASRTIGVFGFTERGFQPSPQSLLSVLAEVATVLLLVAAAARLLRQRGGVSAVLRGLARRGG
jgi:hypothetical protein